tara:strand:- start:1209 stop:2012 length:804 start_codon:yes stop_codon:yes gene_type:complete
MTKVQKRKRSSKSFSSFFAGIGGFDCALDAEGFDPALQCEIDDFCQKVLASHWPDVPLVSDITKICPDELPESEIWCGGFPCQDVSVARGSKGRDGLKGKNSGLFYSFLELVKAKKPETILLENVVGLLSSHNGQDFRVVVEALTKLGYSVAWRIMNSRYLERLNHGHECSFARLGPLNHCHWKFCMRTLSASDQQAQEKDSSPKIGAHKRMRELRTLHIALQPLRVVTPEQIGAELTYHTKPPFGGLPQRSVKGFKGFLLTGPMLD